MVQRKSARTRTASVKDLRAQGLDVAKARAVRGGRKAGGDKPVKYLEYKLKEVLISG